ncbi:deoxyuridine 5'-triphosphate nucleotidohydrolase [Corynebacterium renale]|uniref:dUTP diphosphatase n=1 Tax=Corynebacterium renale TaxID=1724 RepID=UPI000DA41F43|nr:dUTP diphosphatase [Corynebacterium renale]SQG64819.1 deoxyuridine 5'-triphosphate nucleotidohydrolase [Corynebacterium renale]STC96355.1 deoxyuridine 5'-triphosphate nucleotidohydrolase [Corynebacterium renale]
MDSHTPTIRFKKLHPAAHIPTRAHAEDAGADLYSIEELTLEPGQRALVGTGIAIALPIGTVGLVHPRSGLATKNGITVINTPGTIDAGYRGELKISLVNLDPEHAFTITPGMRIAQLLVQKVELVDFEEVNELEETERGSGGHGSTGLHD